MKIFLCVVSLCSILGFCHSQAVRNYNCAIPSLCMDIDPRVGAPVVQPNIVVPGNAAQTACPDGTIQCNSVVCGTPSVPISTNNGFATQNSLPWQAYLRDDLRNQYVGGGVLIDQYNVLTAAHKISNLTGEGASLSVLMGVYNPSAVQPPSQPQQAPIQQSRVLRAYIHSGYNVTANNLKNDVAILRLQDPITFTTSTMTMCLPAAGTNFITEPPTTCLVAGWGQTGFTIYDAPTTSLKQVYVPIVSSASCTQSYSRILGQSANYYLDTENGNEICAGGQAQLDSCIQDGGSPLICRNANSPSYTLAGLVLWGKGCGEADRYGVYLNVPNYLPWISSTAQCATQGSLTCANAVIQNFN